MNREDLPTYQVEVDDEPAGTLADLILANNFDDDTVGRLRSASPGVDRHRRWLDHRSDSRCVGLRRSAPDRSGAYSFGSGGEGVLVVAGDVIERYEIPGQPGMTYIIKREATHQARQRPQRTKRATMRHLRRLARRRAIHRGE